MLPTFTSMQRFQVARSVSTAVPKGWIAAAFTIMSSPPKRVTVSAIIDRIVSSSVTSTFSTSTVDPSFSASSASVRFPAASMPHATTRAPPAAKRSAIARPTPVVPVTNATFPENSFIDDTPPVQGLRASSPASPLATPRAPSTGPPTNIPDSLFSQCRPPANVHGPDAWEFHDPHAPPVYAALLLPAKRESRPIYPNSRPDAPLHKTIRLALASPAEGARSECAN